MSTLSDAKSRWPRKAVRKAAAKGEKNVSAKFAAGNKGHKKESQYSQQLREKQNAKKAYGMREKQFRLLFEKAGRKGNAGENLLKMLESRFDNVIYRFGIAVSRAEARQMVSHGMFTINNKLVNIPSYQVKTGDIITIKKNKRQKKTFANLADKLKKVEVPGWLYFKAADFEGKVLHEPSMDDVDRSINIALIVEFYSK